jgi:hypothetical protein
MEWTRSNTLALANKKCTICLGLGTRLSRRGTFTACDCVLRKIFKICLNRFRDCVEKEKHLSRVTMELHSGPNRRGTWGRKDEEYIVDFLKMAERTLTREEHKIFRYRYLLGADWQLCIRKMEMDRGTFFYMMYRVQVRLGQAFAETEPYGLFPLNEYFGSAPLKFVAKALPGIEEKVVPIRPPVAVREVVDPTQKVA